MITLMSGIIYSKTNMEYLGLIFGGTFDTKELHLQKLLSDRDRENRGNGIRCGMIGSSQRDARLKIHEIFSEFELNY